MQLVLVNVGGVVLDRGCVVPEALGLLGHLKAEGYTVGLFTGTADPERVLTLLGPLLSEVVGVACAQQLGVPKASAEFLSKALEQFGLSPSRVYIVGNSLRTDIELAFLTESSGIWVNQDSSEKNIEALNNGFSYPRTVTSLHYVLPTVKFYDPFGVRVGFVVPTNKKKRSLAEKGVFASSPQIWYNALEPFADLSLQGEYHIIFHKAGDYLHMDKAAALQQLQDYKRLRPHLRIVDPFEGIPLTLSRGATYNSLRATIGSGVVLSGATLRLPWQVELEAPCVEAVLGRLQEDSVEFPVLLKTDQSQYSANSHLICVVFNESGLAEALPLFNEKLIVQEFINHDQTVYKVYIIGLWAKAFPRASCSNLPSSGQNMVKFLSYEPWPTELQVEEDPVARELPQELLTGVASLIKDSLQLTVLGADLLVHSKTGDYVVIDVNPFAFPRAQECPGVATLLDDYVFSLLNTKRVY